MSSAVQTRLPSHGTLASVFRDYAELVKARVTALIMMTVWCGFYFGAAKAATSSLSWTLIHAVLGIGMAAGGTAALNEAMERDLDGRMRRTALRPLVTGRMSLGWGIGVGTALVLGGTVYLWTATNALAALLTLATSVVYLAAYTPLKRVHPVCTFIGAFPGAMPPVLGWAAIRGQLDWEALVLFAIVFFWQFPHFHSIAWLYREDYDRAHIRMLPVVDADGRSTVREIMAYLTALLIATTAPTLLGMAGPLYFLGAVVLGAGFFWTGWRLAASKLSPQNAESKRLARHLLQASVLYLPLLFALMMLNARPS
ncbi:MAG: heme o synthase [Terriglobales bacterium]